MFWSIVSWIPLGLGFWLGFFNRYGRTVYDIRSSSEVVSVDLSSVKKERPCAFVKQADGTVKTFFIESNRLVFGRNKETCDVVYPESKKSISRNHCSVSYNKQTEMFLLEDMDSSYGTFLSSGKKALPHMVYAINPNDKFYIVDKSNEIVLGFAGN